MNLKQKLAIGIKIRSVRTAISAEILYNGGFAVIINQKLRVLNY